MSAYDDIMSERRRKAEAELAACRQQEDERPDRLPATRISAMAAAILLNVHYDTLVAWRRSGGGPPFIQQGATVRYRYDELMTWTGQGTPRSGRKVDARVTGLERDLIKVKAELGHANITIAHLIAELDRYRGRTHSFLATSVTWAVNAQDQITGPLMGATDEPAEITDATIIEALALPWADPTARRRAEEALEIIITDARTEIAQARAEDDRRILTEGLDLTSPIHAGDRSDVHKKRHR